MKMKKKPIKKKMDDKKLAVGGKGKKRTA